MKILKAYAEIDLGQIHYLSSENANKPPLLLLHQAPSSSEMFRDLMGFLGRDFYVIAPDFPGFGQTDQLVDKVSVRGISLIIASFLNSLKISGVRVFGHHSGASVAVQLSHHFPDLVSRLILSGPPSLTKEQQASLRESLVRPFGISEEGEALLESWSLLRAKGRNVPLEISYREFCLQLSAGESVSELYNAVFNHNFRNQLQCLSQPVLVCAGRNDVMYPYLDDAFKILKQGKKIIVGDACGYVCETHTRDLANIIFEFCHQKAPDQVALSDGQFEHGLEN